MKQVGEKIKKNPLMGWLIFLIAVVVVCVGAIIALSITEHRVIENTKLKAGNSIEVKQDPRNENYKNDYPREYNTWKKTQNSDYRSKYNGNQMQDVLEERPEMAILWAGYAFSKDYNAPRGHMYALDDNRNTLRTGTPEHEGDGPQPASCWVCKSPDVPRIMHEEGIEGFYDHKWGDLGDEIVNPIGCASCHDSETMALNISQPTLIEAFQSQGKDINDATPNEMRSLVCAQCHVEYYFQEPNKKVTLPWSGGMTVEQQEEYYDNLGFSDWTHAISKAPMIKAQHPDYEIAEMGIHAQKGVSCADCHMPYTSEGGMKYSDHQIMSPLQNVSNSCQVCHKDSEENLINYVYERQDKANEIRNRIEQELPKAHIMAGAAWDAGATPQEMENTLKLLRAAQWRWDFAVASHGGSFHAPQETQRILSHSLDKSLQAQIEVQKVLAKHGVHDVKMPDISTKEKAQAYLGIDIEKEKAKKEEWKKTVVPKWLESAKAKGNLVSENK